MSSQRANMDDLVWNDIVFLWLQSFFLLLSSALSIGDGGVKCKLIWVCTGRITGSGALLACELSSSKWFVVVDWRPSDEERSSRIDSFWEAWRIYHSCCVWLQWGSALSSQALRQLMSDHNNNLKFARQESESRLLDAQLQFEQDTLVSEIQTATHCANKCSARTFSSRMHSFRRKTRLLLRESLAYHRFIPRTRRLWTNLRSNNRRFDKFTLLPRLKLRR